MTVLVVLARVLDHCFRPNARSHTGLGSEQSRTLLLDSPDTGLAGVHLLDTKPRLNQGVLGTKPVQNLC